MPVLNPLAGPVQVRKQTGRDIGDISRGTMRYGDLTGSRAEQTVLMFERRSCISVYSMDKPPLFRYNKR